MFSLSETPGLRELVLLLVVVFTPMSMLPHRDLIYKFQTYFSALVDLSDPNLNNNRGGGPKNSHILVE